MPICDGFRLYTRIVGEVERSLTVIERHVSIDPNAILLVVRGSEPNTRI